MLASYFGVIEKIQASVRMGERTKADYNQARLERHFLTESNVLITYPLILMHGTA